MSPDKICYSTWVMNVTLIMFEITCTIKAIQVGGGGGVGVVLVGGGKGEWGLCWGFLWVCCPVRKTVFEFAGLFLSVYRRPL